MLTYNKRYSEFCSDINRGQITDEIIKNLNRNFSPSEKRAFRVSLSSVKNALCNVNIPDDAQVGIEFKVPLTNKRIDFVIGGKDDQNNNNLVVVELKQWDQVTHTDMSDIVLLKNEQHVHPSWQAYSYSTTMSNFNEYIEENPINIYSCTFLHDYNKEFENEIRNEIYSEGLQKAPAFLNGEWEEFAEFVAKKITKKADVDLLYEINNGRIKPSKYLVKSLDKLLNQNEDIITLIDEQRIAYSNIWKEIKEGVNNRKRKRKVIIVKGGAGTGKSLIALKLLGDLHNHGFNAFYVTKSSYVKESYSKILTKGIPNYNLLRTLFRGSGDFHKKGYNTDKQFDCLLVDEAHRLTEKTKVSYMFYGENQIKEIIHAARTSVFFIDETQQIDIKDFGTIENIRNAAIEENAEIIDDERFVLRSQFRCNGSDEYISWVESVLYNKPYNNGDKLKDYEIKVFDSPSQMYQLIKTKNSISNTPSRMLSGDVFPWISMRDKNAIDINIEDFHAQWNKKKSFAVDSKSINEVGCIHTSQGMEFEYVGLIIGNDLIYRNGTVLTDYTKHPSSAGEFRRPHQLKPKVEDEKIFDLLIRNTYKVLFTRGQKGIYLYIMDPQLKEYLNLRIKEIIDR